MWVISVGLLLALILTCGLSWFVAYGNAGLADLRVRPWPYLLLRRERSRVARRGTRAVTPR